MKAILTAITLSLTLVAGQAWAFGTSVDVEIKHKKNEFVFQAVPGQPGKYELESQETIQDLKITGSGKLRKVIDQDKKNQVQRLRRGENYEGTYILTLSPAANGQVTILTDVDLVLKQGGMSVPMSYEVSLIATFIKGDYAAYLAGQEISLHLTEESRKAAREVTLEKARKAFENLGKQLHAQIPEMRGNIELKSFKDLSDTVVYGTKDRLVMNSGLSEIKFVMK